MEGKKMAAVIVKYRDTLPSCQILLTNKLNQIN